MYENGCDNREQRITVNIFVACMYYPLVNIDICMDNIIEDMLNEQAIRWNVIFLKVELG